MRRACVRARAVRRRQLSAFQRISTWRTLLTSSLLPTYSRTPPASLCCLVMLTQSAVAGERAARGGESEDRPPGRPLPAAPCSPKPSTTPWARPGRAAPPICAAAPPSTSWRVSGFKRTHEYYVAEWHLSSGLSVGPHLPGVVPSPSCVLSKSRKTSRIAGVATLPPALPPSPDTARHERADGREPRTRCRQRVGMARCAVLPLRNACRGRHALQNGHFGRLMRANHRVSPRTSSARVPFHACPTRSRVLAVSDRV